MLPMHRVAQFTPDDRILLLGEGNFSFARSLARLMNYEGFMITATAYDAEDVCRAKYTDLDDILGEITDAGVQVMFSIDGGELHRTKQLRGRMFDYVIFNFPHAGLGIKDESRNILSNQKLLVRVFEAVARVLKPTGELHITLKDGKPYDLWNVKELGKWAGYRVRTSWRFDPSCFPGYEHRRTLGFKPGVSARGNAELKDSARTYAFVPVQNEPGPREKPNQSGRSQSGRSQSGEKRQSGEMRSRTSDDLDLDDDKPRTRKAKRAKQRRPRQRRQRQGSH